MSAEDIMRHGNRKAKLFPHRMMTSATLVLMSDNEG